MTTDPNAPSLIQALAVEVYNEASKKGKPKGSVDLVKGGTSAERRSARAAVANQPGNQYGAQSADGGKAQRASMAAEAASRRASSLVGYAPTGLTAPDLAAASNTARTRAAGGKDLISGGTAADRRRLRKNTGISTRAQRWVKAANAGKPKTGGTPAGTY